MSDHGAPVGDTAGRVRGTAGYAEEADALAVQYEEVGFEQVHGEVLHLVPAAPGHVPGEDLLECLWPAKRTHRLSRRGPT